MAISRVCKPIFPLKTLIAHGFLTVPMTPTAIKEKAFAPAVKLIREAHQERGWQWSL